MHEMPGFDREPAGENAPQEVRSQLGDHHIEGSLLGSQPDVIARICSQRLGSIKVALLFIPGFTIIDYRHRADDQIKHQQQTNRQPRRGDHARCQGFGLSGWAYGRVIFVHDFNV